MLPNFIGTEYLTTPLSPKDYQTRIEKAQRLMAEQKIDGLLLTGGTNLLYFTNVRWGRSERTRSRPVPEGNSYVLTTEKNRMPIFLDYLSSSRSLEGVSSAREIGVEMAPTMIP